MTATKPKPKPSKSPVLLVTGGDTGIGLGIARKFAEAGYRMAIGGLARRRGHRVGGRSAVARPQSRS
jgi:NAD(P)-dependent dehydrogenase (short-subunit alcohol dehydrogenase family)